MIRSIDDRWIFIYVKGPKVALNDPDMTPDAYWVYQHIYSRCGVRGKRGHLSLNQAMADTGFKKSKLYENLKILKEIGLLKIIPRFSESNNGQISSEYALVPPCDVYGDIVDVGWPAKEDVKAAREAMAKGETELIEGIPETRTPPSGNQDSPLRKPGIPSIYLKEDIKEEDIEEVTTTTTSHSTSHSSNSHSQSTDSLAVKLLFAGMGKKDKPKQVDKPKNKTFAFDVSKEIKDCHNCYSEHMSRNGLFGGGLNKKKIDVWSSFLERFKTVSDGLKVINYVLTHWDTLKRKYRLTESLPAIYFFQTGYIDSISIEVLAKATTTGSRPNDYEDFSKLADRVRAKSKWSDPDE